jgi:hypothetical protein
VKIGNLAWILGKEQIMAYSPTMMRFAQQDPAGYVDGLNDYQFVSSSPMCMADPSGLAPQPNWALPVPDYPPGEPTGEISQAVAEIYMNEAYNRSAAYWDQMQRMANTGLGTAGPVYEAYHEQNQKWFSVYAAWANVIGGYAKLKLFLAKHPNARYGNGQDGSAVNAPGYDEKYSEWEILTLTKPKGLLAFDIANAVINKHQSEDAMPMDYPDTNGLIQDATMRDNQRKILGRDVRPGTDLVRREVPINEARAARMDAAGEGIERGTYAAGELFGKLSFTLKLWVKDEGCAGFFLIDPALGVDGRAWTLDRLERWYGISAK